MTGLETATGVMEAIRRRARVGGSYYIRTTLSKNCTWLQEFGTFDISELEGQPKTLLDNPGLAGTLKTQYIKPVVNVLGPRGELQV